MKLQVGERLPGCGPAGQPGGYVVAGVVHETAWTTLYAARKILYNFDFAGQRCRETDDKEWLDVLLRVVHTPSRIRCKAPPAACVRRAMKSRSCWPIARATSGRNRSISWK